MQKLSFFIPVVFMTLGPLPLGTPPHLRGEESAIPPDLKRGLGGSAAGYRTHSPSSGGSGRARTVNTASHSYIPPTPEVFRTPSSQALPNKVTVDSSAHWPPVARLLGSPRPSMDPVRVFSPPLFTNGVSTTPHPHPDLVIQSKPPLLVTSARSPHPPSLANTGGMPAINTEGKPKATRHPNKGIVLSAPLPVAKVSMTHPLSSVAPHSDNTFPMSVLVSPILVFSAELPIREPVTLSPPRPQTPTRIGETVKVPLPPLSTFVRVSPESKSEEPQEAPGPASGTQTMPEEASQLPPAPLTNFANEENISTSPHPQTLPRLEEFFVPPPPDFADRPPLLPETLSEPPSPPEETFEPDSPSSHAPGDESFLGTPLRARMMSQEFTGSPASSNGSTLYGDEAFKESPSSSERDGTLEESSAARPSTSLLDWEMTPDSPTSSNGSTLYGDEAFKESPNPSERGDDTFDPSLTTDPLPSVSWQMTTGSPALSDKSTLYGDEAFAPSPNPSERRNGAFKVSLTLPSRPIFLPFGPGWTGVAASSTPCSSADQLRLLTEKWMASVARATSPSTPPQQQPSPDEDLSPGAFSDAHTPPRPSRSGGRRVTLVSPSSSNASSLNGDTALGTPPSSPSTFAKNPTTPSTPRSPLRRGASTRHADPETP